MAAALVALSTATDARADEEYTTTGGSGTIEVKMKEGSHWHINKEAPWKATVGSTTLGKDKWSLSDGKATVSGVPAGEAKVKIYVCNGDQCRNAEATVRVK